MNRPNGQSLNDRITAARYTLAGQGLARVVCKATTEELRTPKKKHLDYLLHCTNEPNVSIPQLANFLIERTQNGSWIVVFKSLVTVHNLMCYGSERFTQYLASSNCNFNLASFNDRLGTPQGPEMSTFIRRHSKYLNEKALSYRMVAFDFCKVKRGKEQGEMRSMAMDKLLKIIPILQAQTDALLEFDASPSDLNNGIITSAFMLLFKDLLRLFASYNDGIINILEKFFNLQKKQCREALDCYKKFLVRMDRVAEFLKVAENIGIDKGEIPDLKRAPSSLLDALEQHLATLEGRKYVPSTPQPPNESASASNGFANAVSILSSTSNSFGNTVSQNDFFRQALVDEEEKALRKLKSSHNGQIANEEWFTPLDSLISIQDHISKAGAASSEPSNPFLVGTNESANNDIMNLFDAPIAQQPPPVPAAPSKASDDLANLNPFADSGLFSIPSGIPPANPLNQVANDLFGAPAPAALVQTAHSDSIIKGDLDSTLANLASNLDISPAHRFRTPSKPQTTTLAQMSSAKQMTAGAGAGWNPDFSTASQQPGAANAGEMIFSDLFSTNTPVAPVQAFNNNNVNDPFGLL